MKREVRLPSSPPLRGAGFSLLELLVVIFIIGILATMFTLSVGILGSDSELDEETGRLQALLDLAREEAVTRGREFGVHFYPGGYEFAIYEEDFIEYYDPEDETQDQSEWTVLRIGTMLRPRTLPDSVVIELEIDGREIVLDEKNESLSDESGDEPGAEPGADVEENDRYRPQILLFSTGDMSPFVIRFRREFADTGLILDFGEDGSVELSEG